MKCTYICQAEMEKSIAKQKSSTIFQYAIIESQCTYICQAEMEKSHFA
jgi:hypothetical protein